MDESEGVNIENLGDDLYQKVLETIGFLMALDPALGTPLGNLLSNLADAVIQYEKEKGWDFPEQITSE